MTTRTLASRIRFSFREALSDYHTHGRLWIPLGLTSLGLGAAATMLTVFLPVVLSKFTSSGTLIGFALGGEGIFAVLLSIVIGPLSDRAQTPLGRRRPFMLVGLLIAAAALTLAPLMPSYWAVVGIVFAFFVGYYLIGIPYRALSTDVLPPDQYGRAQGYQQLLRGFGFILGFALGASLFPFSQFLPFAIVSGLMLFAGVTTILAIHEQPTTRPPLTFRRELLELWRAWQGHIELRKSLLAAFLFEAYFAGLRTFTVLFFLKGLGLPFYWVAVAVGIVTVANIVGAILSGTLADRYGIRRVLFYNNLILAPVLILPFIWQPLWFIFILMPPFAIMGAATVTLSFPLIMEIIPEGREGGYSGLFEFARGFGIVLGPIAVGAAIDIYGTLHGPHHGYPAMWLVLSLFILLSAFVLRRLSPDPDLHQRARVEASYAESSQGEPSATIKNEASAP